MSTPVRYGSWSVDRGASFGGLGAGTWVSAAAAGIPVFAALGAQRWALAAAWTPVWAVSVVLVAVPVRGRTPLRWSWDACHRLVGSALGWTSWQSRAAAGDVDDLEDVDLPGVLSGMRTHDGPPFGPLLARPAVVSDDRERTWSVVARIAHPGIGLAEAGTRTRLGHGLAELLESAATGELVSSVALQVRTVPDDGAERSAWQAANRRADAPALAHAVIDELADIMTAAGVRHEAFVTVVVPERRISRLAKEAGGGTDGRARVLYGLMSELEARLLGPVGCSSVTWLDSPGLAAAVRTGFAPGDRARLTTEEPDLPMALAGPSSAPPPERRHYEHDAWQTVTCTVLLPDKGAVMGALAPVLVPTAAGERRSVTAFFEPISHTRADRMIGGESMSSELTNEIRRRGGFRVRAAHRQEAARVEGRDMRFAEGNALVRVAVAAAVTVPATWSVSDFGRRLESSITNSGFRPLRLDLAQDSGFAAACIPLGVGLPRRRGVR